MDSGTKWLIRGAAIMAIAVGGTGVVKMLGFLDKPQTISETKVTVDLDKIRNTGNMCPSGFAYVGGGYCRNIICISNPTGHDGRLGGKGHRCKKPLIGRLSLQFGNQTVRATTDERCPLVEPEVGRVASCQNGLTEDEIKSGKFRNKHHWAGKTIFGTGVVAEFRENDLLVKYMEEQSPYRKSGLQIGDVIIEVFGEPIPKRYLDWGRRNNKKHSYLLDNLYETFRQKGADIGIRIDQKEFSDSGQFIIKRVIKGQPASKSGLKVNDVIVEIDGESIEGMGLEALKLRGSEFSKIKIKVLRDQKTIIKTIKRELPIERELIVVLRDGKRKELIVQKGKYNVPINASIPNNLN